MSNEKHSAYGLLFCHGCKSFVALLFCVLPDRWRCGKCRGGLNHERQGFQRVTKNPKGIGG